VLSQRFSSFSLWPTFFLNTTHIRERKFRKFEDTIKSNESRPRTVVGHPKRRKSNKSTKSSRRHQEFCREQTSINSIKCHLSPVRAAPSTVPSVPAPSNCRPSAVQGPSAVQVLPSKRRPTIHQASKTKSARNCSVFRCQTGNWDSPLQQEGRQL
jgi:hypothetical protein